MTGLHRTTIDEKGLARMGEVDALDLPAGGTAQLEPGGFHIMLTGVGSLVEGDTVEITLLLEGSGPLDIAAEVRAFGERRGSVCPAAQAHDILMILTCGDG